jgi:hypothetical protein
MAHRLNEIAQTSERAIDSLEVTSGIAAIPI